MSVVFFAISFMLNIGLICNTVMNERAVKRFKQFMKQKEHLRDRVARALVDRFRYRNRMSAHEMDVAKSQGTVGYPLALGFAGKVEAYGHAANDIQHFIVWGHDPSELLEEVKSFE